LIDIPNGLSILGHLFLDDPDPPGPLGACGLDEAPRGLGCGGHAPCDA
jgi:hypothetical protein